MAKEKSKRSPLQGILRFVTKKRLGTIGLIYLILMLLVAIFADVIAPVKMVNGTLPTDVIHKLETPYILMNSAERAAARASDSVYWLGTDNLGRDVLSYLIYGARTSVVLCLAVTALSTVLSVVIGTLSAVIGGWFDLIVQRFVDAWQCIPAMLLTILMMSMFGNGMLQMILVMSIPSGIGGSRMIRSSAISVKDSGYVTSAEMMGSGILWKTVRHVLPNILPLIITSAAGGLGGVIMMEASMNFLGYGVSVGTPSWGYMITNQGRANMYTAPWLCIFPGILIALMVLAANLFGDSLRDFMDPRLQQGVGSYDSRKIARMAAKFDRRAQKARARAEKKSSRRQTNP